MALLGMLMTSDQPAEEETEVEETPTPPAPPPAEFWTDTDVADNASTAITGSSVDSFVGYTAASATATPDPLTAVGKGSCSVATFDMSAGGNNYFVAADHAGASSGSLSYTGRSGDDNLTFGEYLARNGSATFDMSAGGNNIFVVDDPATTSTLAGFMGSLSYTGGAGNDSITINGDGLGYGGNVTIDMSAGGNNTFMTGHSAATGIGLSPSFLYTGGSATDSLTFGDNLAAWGSATFDMSAGGTNTFMAGSNAGMSGTVSYTGGMGVDIITFGSNASVTQEPATGDGASLNIDLGADAVADTITFQGSVGSNNVGGVVIQNFDPTDDTIRFDGIAATSQLAIGNVPGGVVISSTAGAATTIQMALDGNNAGDIDLTVVSGAVEIG